MEDQYPYGDKDYTQTEFIFIPQQEKEREKEMSEDQPHTNPPPTALNIFPAHRQLAHVIPKCFLRYIGAVDEEILAKYDVSPENRKCQHQTAEQVIMGWSV